ncbi:hypothetical protein KORDIASMS9_02668 [Kordia sp. SMS9]|uniref:oxidase n=1 Tax=Kordia sp. SMS9 TaxID=2282170 RepID=UPI000E0DBFAD|nr:oxidase [Kordia sp. SMS9]AXG70428.1 hypothetical protein KORDIASMS9_02668 [Kordia sp. SMS9]
MSDRVDFLLDETGDLAIVNGDFVIGPSDQQHVSMIVKAHQGEFKEHPLTGFGISRYLKKTNAFKPEFLRDLKVQLGYDGYQNAEINLEEGIEKLTIKV